MAELDPYIIFRQKEYSGPTQDELDTKQDMNALRNMLGAGQSIDSPEVVNAMTARNPDLGLKLMTNANTMRNDAASLQTKQQEARIARLNGLVPTALAIAKNRDQAAWGQFKTYLQQIDPEATMGYPDDVNKAETFVQNFIDAQRAQKGVSSALPYQATEMGGYLQKFNRATGQMELVLDNEGRPMRSNAVTTAGIGAESRETVAGITAGSRENVAAANQAAANARQDAKAYSQAAQAGVTGATVTPVGAAQPAPDQPGAAASVPEAKRMSELRAALPKARSNLAAAEDKFNTLTSNIDSLITDPALAKITGDELATYRGSFPTLFGPGAARAQAKLDQLLAQGGFSELATMRQESPTGGALGNVSDKEGALLQAAFGRLKQAQTAKDVVAALNDIKGVMARSRARLRGAFDEEYGQLNTAGGAAAPAGGAAAPAGGAAAPASTPTTSGW